MTNLGSSSDDFPLFADASPADRFSTGMVTETKVLEAPDTPIANAVETAVKRWTFRPFLVEGKPVTFKSRVIFYFRVLDRKPVVVDATASIQRSSSRPTNGVLENECGGCFGVRGLFPTHNPTHKNLRLIRLPRSLAVPAVV